MWGTLVSSMQSDVAVDMTDKKITGSLAYLSSGQLVTDWGAGNFLALKFTAGTGVDKIQVGLNPSEGSGLVYLDEDLNGVFKITDKDEQKFIMNTIDVYGNVIEHQEYDLSELVVTNA